MSQELQRACSLFAIPTRPELGWCCEDPAWGTPTASPARGWCPFPWVQAREGRCGGLERESSTYLWAASIWVDIMRDRKKKMHIQRRGMSICSSVWMSITHTFTYLETEDNQKMRNFSLFLIFSSTWSTDLFLFFLDRNIIILVHFEQDRHSLQINVNCGFS